MIRLKKIDCYGQLTGIVLFPLLACLDSSNFFFDGYFVVGTWQLLSLLFHALFCSELLHRARKFYAIAVLLLATLAIPFLFHSASLLGYFLLVLFVSPIMAVCYLLISFSELKNWQARAWIHLK